MKLTIQPKFSSVVTSRRPGFTDPRGNFNKAYQEAFGTYNRDYAIEVYFKENGRTKVRRSKYTMGELAHHLMVEGQYSKSAKRIGRPHGQMSVVYDEDGKPKRNRAGKYLLQNDTGYKKIWNFVKTGAERHKNWRKEIRALTEDMFIRRFARMLINQFTGKSMSGINFYTGMQRVARKVLADLKEELLGLVEPELDPKTIRKKKGKKDILIETKKLFNALAVRVVPLKSKPKSRINFGRKFSQSNQKLSFEEIEQLKEYLATGGDESAQEEFFKSAHIKEDARKALKESEGFDETISGAEETSYEEYDSEQREDDSNTDLGEFLYRNT